MPPRSSTPPPLAEVVEGTGSAHISPTHPSIVRPPSLASGSSPLRRTRIRPFGSMVQSAVDESEPQPASIGFHLPLDMDDLDRSDRLDDLDPNPARQTATRYPISEIEPPITQSLEDPLHNFNPLMSLDELLDGSSTTEATQSADPTHRSAGTASTRTPRELYEDDSRLRAQLRQDDRALRNQIRQDAIRAQFPGLESATTRREAHTRSRRPNVQLERLIGALGADTDEDEDEDEDMGSDPETFMPEWEYSADDAGLFRMANRSTDELAVLGGSGARVTLRRGAYNRNRRSIMDRMRGRDAEIPNDGILVSTEVVRRSGMRPTNPDGATAPEVVQSPLRKNKSGTISPSRLMKRRKVEDKVDAKPPLTPARPTYLLYTTLSSADPLPESFTPPHRYSRVSLSSHQTSSAPPRPCITFTYSPLPHGPNDDDYASSLRSNIPIPVACGVHYYEAEVLDAGESGYMSVGWMKSNVSLDRLVGWDKGSWGWHGDDGRSFEGRGEGEVFGEGWSKGDVVGCGVDFTLKKAFFTKNGKFIGYRFKDLGEGLHPAIGLRTPQESLAVNFTGPFKYDIDNYVRNIRDTTWRTAITPRTPDEPSLATQNAKDKKKAEKAAVVASAVEDPDRSIPFLVKSQYLPDVDLPPQSTLHDPMERTSAAFILNYLRHEGHESALRSVKTAMRSRGWIVRPTKTENPLVAEHDEMSSFDDFSSSEACIAWIEKRIINADTLPLPMNLLESLLGQDELAGVYIHQYLFLVRGALSARYSAAPTEDQGDLTPEQAEKADEADLLALQYGQKLRKMSQGWKEEERTSLKEAFGLISVESSTWREDGVGGKAKREKDAESVVALIRQNLGMSNTSYLSQAFSQTTASLRLLAPLHPDAAFIDPSRILTDIGCLGSSSTKVRKEVKVEPETEA